MTFSFFVPLQRKVHTFTYAERGPDPTQTYLVDTHAHRSKDL